MKNLVNAIMDPIFKILGLVGKKINSCPTKEENAQCGVNPKFGESIMHKEQKHFEAKNDHLHKGDHKAKGSDNTDSKIFNHSRR